jgi:hypothetical protein
VTGPLLLARSPEDQLAQWKSVLASGNVAQIAYLARLMAESRSAVDTTFRFTVCDKFWTPIGNIGEELMEASGTDPRNDVPTAKLMLKGSSDIVDMFMECRKTMVGCIVETAGLTFPFYTKNHSLKYKRGEGTTGNVVLNGIWDILSYLVIWPTWWLPIQTQPFSHAIYMWALCTVAESMVSDCALRIQSGLNEFVNNAFSLNPDIRAWFGRILQIGAGNGISQQSLFSILHTPVYVKRTNPFLDSSPLVGRTVRMETCAAVIKDISRAYGVDTRMDLWRPGDPQPDPWSFLSAPTYVFSTADRSQIEGPTHTIADSVIRTVIDLGGSLGNILAPVIREVPGMAGTYDAPILGVKHQPPWATVIVPDDGEDGSVIEAEINDHTPEGWQHIIGGRSPKWAGAPLGDWGGTGPQGNSMTQRSDQRHDRLADRQPHDRRRPGWYPKRPARRVPQQFVFRVPTDPALRAPRGSRPVPPGHRGLPRDQLSSLLSGNAVRLHQRAI